MNIILRIVSFNIIFIMEKVVLRSSIEYHKKRELGKGISKLT